MGRGDEPEATGLTHIGPDGAARMVDVGGKVESERRAVAEAVVRLAHPLPLSFADVHAVVDPDAGTVTLTAETRCVGRTGVEIEAMAAASIAALTVYDMVKAIERGVEIERVRQLHKSGGKSGEWNAADG